MGVAGGVTISGALDYAIIFSDGGVLTGLGAEINQKIATDMGNRLTEDNHTSPDRILYFGDPINALDLNATTVMPSFKQRLNNSAHPYRGLFIKDAVPIHDTMKNNLKPSPDDSQSEIITYLINQNQILIHCLINRI